MSTPIFALATLESESILLTYADRHGILQQAKTPRVEGLAEDLAVAIQTHVPEVTHLIVVGQQLSQDGQVLTVGAAKLRLPGIAGELAITQMLFGTAEPAAGRSSRWCFVSAANIGFWLDSTNNLPDWIDVLNPVGVTPA